jgi:hypothetical protein
VSARANCSRNQTTAEPEPAAHQDRLSRLRASSSSASSAARSRSLEFACYLAAGWRQRA